MIKSLKKFSEYSVGDKVLAKPEWEYGERHGYHKKPGEVVEKHDEDTYSVKWHDGHESIHGSNELIRHKHSVN